VLAFPGLVNVTTPGVIKFGELFSRAACARHAAHEPAKRNHGLQSRDMAGHVFVQPAGTAGATLKPLQARLGDIEHDHASGKA